jgi:hypothetical protein
MRPCALILRVKSHHARPRTTVDKCSCVLAMGLVLLAMLVMLRLTTTAAGRGGQTLQTSKNALVLPCRPSVETPSVNAAQIASALLCSLRQDTVTASGRKPSRRARALRAAVRAAVQARV